ncbi:hypothetical protein J6590_020041 [Homalodisca vitripennis]|nr:hypothetical protein J6590_020041 [Homalodisca vitripennis]
MTVPVLVAPRRCKLHADRQNPVGNTEYFPPQLFCQPCLIGELVFRYKRKGWKLKNVIFASNKILQPGHSKITVQKSVLSSKSKTTPGIKDVFTTD